MRHFEREDGRVNWPRLISEPDKVTRAAAIVIAPVRVVYRFDNQFWRTFQRGPRPLPSSKPLSSACVPARAWPSPARSGEVARQAAQVVRSTAAGTLPHARHRRVFHQRPRRALLRLKTNRLSHTQPASLPLAYDPAHTGIDPIPPIDDFALTLRKARRTAVAQQSAWEQACRQRWRALLLIIRAKLEAVESGLTTLESEFLANIVVPDGGTVGQWLAPQVEEAYATGRMPPMLEAGGFTATSTT